MLLLPTNFGGTPDSLQKFRKPFSFVLKLSEMGSDCEIEKTKPRFLCLHGFRTSGEILKKQVYKWPQSILGKMDLVFVDAPFPSQGKSGVEGIFDPPYYEWFQFNKDLTEYSNFDECLACIEDYMIKHGPFDGLLGFSQYYQVPSLPNIQTAYAMPALLRTADPLPGQKFQTSETAKALLADSGTADILPFLRSYDKLKGAILSGALPGLQAAGLALTKVPKIKYLIIIGGAKFGSPPWLAEKAYSSPIECPSVHFLGKRDFMRKYGLELLESFVDPCVIHHPKGHTIPRLDESGLQIMLNFIEKTRMAPRKEE